MENSNYNNSTAVKQVKIKLSDIQQAKEEADVLQQMNQLFPDTPHTQRKEAINELEILKKTMTVYKQYLNKNQAQIKKEREINTLLKEKIKGLETEAMFKDIRDTKQPQ